MEFFKTVSIDWLGMKWYLIAISGVVLLIGAIGYVVRGGFAWGVDFTGGTVSTLKFQTTPDLDAIRRALKTNIAGTTVIQHYDDPAKNTVVVRVQRVAGAGEDVDAAKRALLTTLRKEFDSQHVDGQKIDFNNVARQPLTDALQKADPDNLKGQNKTTQEFAAYYEKVGLALLDYRDKVGEGMVASLDDLKKAPGVSAAVVEKLQQDFYAGPFAVKGVESVGAVVGSDLRRRAALAVGLSFLGMLVYIGFRFKPIYGVAAVVAILHDVAVTLGLLALFQKEISLTVIAALLTLVGYSVNDTIVIFDRVRENLRLMRKESLTRVLNISVNQTLSRTILTSGMTFLSVLALFLFGGEVLNGFAFVLTVGLISGTYSTLSIASPIVEFWYRTVNQRSRRKAA
jgi:preprotein translocase subunit SecF